ncbi:MAG: hypothetical protein ACQETZ_05210 [Candidatus Fermentibacterota bacterium]
MRASLHAAAGAAAGLAVGSAMGTGAGAGTFLASALLDADHVGHFAGRGMSPTPANLARAYFMTPRKLQRHFGLSRGIPDSWAFPALHSVELAAGLLAAWLVTGHGLVLGLLLGTALHLAMDTRYYPGGWASFSLVLKYLRRATHRDRWRRFHPGRSVRER